MVTQAELARELNVAEMTIHRALKALYRHGRPLTDLDAVAVFAAAELQTFKLSARVATGLLSDMESEVRYVASCSTHRCWIVFAETERAKFLLPAIGARHLESILDAHPLSRVLSLHEVIARAAERLEVLKAKRTRDAA